MSEEEKTSVWLLTYIYAKSPKTRSDRYRIHYLYKDKDEALKTVERDRKASLASWVRYGDAFEDIWRREIPVPAGRLCELRLERKPLL